MFELLFYGLNALFEFFAVLLNSYIDGYFVGLGMAASEWRMMMVAYAVCSVRW
jgi:hypothetical protein